MIRHVRLHDSELPWQPDYMSIPIHQRVVRQPRGPDAYPHRRFFGAEVQQQSRPWSMIEFQRYQCDRLT